jgi:hypothetical protein
MSRSKAKGTRWETAIVEYLREVAPHVERRALNGAHDKGDITGIPGVVIEAKNQERHSLAEWVDEAVAEGDNANADVAVAWIHRRGKASPADGYVVMTGTQFVSLLLDAGYLDRRPDLTEETA